MTSQNLLRRALIGLALVASVAVTVSAPASAAGKPSRAPARPAGGGGGQDIIVFDIVDS